MKTRFSLQRQVIYEAVQENRVHPTAEFIYHYLKPDHPQLSLGTVYRNLQYLVDNSKILKLNFPNHVDMYDADMSKHYHAICQCCGEIKDIYIDYLHGIDDMLEEKLGTKVTSHSIVFNIVCENCAKKN